MDNLQDPVIVKERIDRNLEELGNLSSEDRSRSRKEILDELSRDLAEYYGYLPELIDLFLDLFSPAECVQYIEASERPRPLVIRTNTLKTTRKELMENLTKRGANVEAVEWSKVAIKITESTVPIGATPEYLAGHYMLQAASSLNPVMALAPEPGEKVLDMSSAPGGKTSYIAQLMKNAGFLLANDLKPMRQKATIANLHRLGVKNAVVCCHDGRKIGQTMKGFDRVLLDAPCSGMGIISRDPSVKLQRTVKDIERMAHLQKELLRTAIDVVQVNGVVVYSTCSITVEENEMVVNYILQKRHVKVVETGLQVGRAGLTRYKERRFHPSVANTRRFYPHVHNMDGFYVAKIVKLAHGEKQGDDEEAQGSENDEEEEEESEEDSMDVDEEDEDSEEEEKPVKNAKKPAATKAAVKPTQAKKRKLEESESDDDDDEEESEEEEEEEEVKPAPKSKKVTETVAAKVEKKTPTETKTAVSKDAEEATSTKKKARTEPVAEVKPTTPARDFDAAKTKLLKTTTPAKTQEPAVSSSTTPAVSSAVKSAKKATEKVPVVTPKSNKKTVKIADEDEDEEEEEEEADLSKAIRGRLVSAHDDDDEDSDEDNDLDEDDEDTRAFLRVAASSPKAHGRGVSPGGSGKKPKSISALRQMSASKKKLGKNA